MSQRPLLPLLCSIQLIEQCRFQYDLGFRDDCSRSNLKPGRFYELTTLHHSPYGNPFAVHMAWRMPGWVHYDMSRVQAIGYRACAPEAHQVRDVGHCRELLHVRRQPPLHVAHLRHRGSPIRALGLKHLDPRPSKLECALEDRWLGRASERDRETLRLRRTAVPTAPSSAETEHRE